MIDWPEPQPRETLEHVPTRTEGCACGGLITADPSSEMSILRAVRLHNASPRHEEWTRLGGLEFSPELLGRSLEGVA